MKIVVIEPLGVSAEEMAKLTAPLRGQGHEVVIYGDRSEDFSELARRGAGADVVLLTNLPFDRKVIEACSNLKMISVAFTGVDHIDMAACRERGIVVSNAAGYSTEAVAELVIALAISVYRRIAFADQMTRGLKGREGFAGLELHGKTVGIVGTGAIGLRTAELFKAFGCKILAYSRHQKGAALELGIKYVSLEELVSVCDIVSLHVPLTPETKHLIDGKMISLMPEKGVLINTARGLVVDNDALAAALQAGKIAGAGIDVYETEPPLKATHPLLAAPNTVLLPHLGFATREAIVTRAGIVCANVAGWLAGKPVNVM